ncbi:MAG: PAS domain S-box protein [Candidatus Hodarchaeota archaeon]
MEVHHISEKPLLSKIFILCIDDEPDFLELTKIFLEKEDDRLRVDTSTSVEEALECLRNKTYEAIVCDYQMPVMDGLEFLETLRNQNNLIPFIILTGKGREEVAIKALNLGADRYLQKGGDPKALYGILAQSIIQEVNHKRAEKLMHESEEKYRNLVERASDGITITQDNIIKYANQSLASITGYNVEELIESSYTNYIHPDEISKIQENIDRMIELKQPQTFETVLVTKEGKSKDIEVNIGRISFQDKPATLTFVRDITERKEAEKEQFVISSLLKAQYETSIDGILVVEDSGRVILYNNRFKEMWNIPQDILDSKDAKKIRYYILEQLKDPEEFSERIEYLNVHPNEESMEEIEFLDGRIFDRYSSPLVDEVGNQLGRIWYFRDITERKRADIILEETKNKYQMLIEKLEEGLTVEDPEGFITFVNPKTLESLGYTEDEIIGKHWSFIVPEKDREESYIETAKRPKGISSTYESRLLAKDGSIIPVIVTATPIISNTGEFQGVIVLSTDITERKHAERALKQSEEREKFLLTLLRHDIKNKIYIIRGYLDLLSKSKLSKENRKLIEKALITSEKSHQLLEKVGMLRDIDQEDEVIKVILDYFLQDAIEKNQDKIEENKIAIEYEGPSYKVLGGPLLEELFNNIIENSIKHAKCSKIKISCQERNGKVIIILEDDGVGIPKQVRDNILLEEYRGEASLDTGIGLLLIKRIAERYGGNIDIKDSILGGARIDIELNKA